MEKKFSKKSEFEIREAVMLDALENIRQKSLNELYRTSERVSDIIRDVVDGELLDLETKERKSKYA